MASRDALGMSLDDIIRLNKQKKGNGSVTSRGTQGRRRGMNNRGRGGSINRGRGSISSRGRGGIGSRGRGGIGSQGRGGIGSRGRGGIGSRGRGGSSPRARGGISSRARGGSSQAGGGSFQARGVINRRGRGGMIRGNLGGGTIRGRGSPNLGRGRINSDRRPQTAPARRGLRGFQANQGKRFLGNRGITNSFRSDQIIRQQAIEQKLNKARTLKQLTTKNSVTGASDMLTVCITNDLAEKRKRRSSSVPRFGSANNFRRDSFMRRGNNNSYLNRQSLARLNASTGGSSVVSSEGSVVTTISRRSRSSSVGRNRNRRASSVGRNGFVRQNQGHIVVEQYAPVSNWQPRSGLNLQLQKEIAAIQGKTYMSSTSIGFANGSGISSGLSEFRPVPTLTKTTLNERFS